MTKKPPESGITKGHRQLYTRVKTARGRKSSSTKWLQRQLNDPFVQMARKEGYRSRAAYKLLQINDKYNILKPGASVVDLGAAPGGWIQVALKHTQGGKVIGIDLQEMEPIPGATLLVQDFTESAALEKLDELLEGKKVDVVLSDMAAPSCGHSPTDHIRIIVLLELAIHYAIDVLAEGGSFVGKILQGGTERELLTMLQRHFTTVKHFKPEASRQDSSEMYVVALGFKG
jgi:23S rRNA (uridine2552-2'-O)-methyltransferase